MRVVPGAKRAEIGDALLGACVTDCRPALSKCLGNQALEQLNRRLLADSTGRIAVLPGGVRASTHLPGGILLISRTLVEDFDAPDVAAGYILAEDLRQQAQDPLRPLLTHAGFVETLKLYTTGALSNGALESYAEALLTATRPAPDTDMLLERFRAAGISSAPYAFGLDPSGETTLALIEADPFPDGPPRPVLPDAAWVSLQSICGP